MTRNTDDLDDMWTDREQIAETEYAVSIFEHDEINEKKDEEDTTEDL